MERSRGKAGILLRNLVEAYRHSYLEGQFPQRAGLKCFYQTPGQSLVKISFRVENGVWLEFGQMAAYLGVSRCYLFAYLLELAAMDSYEIPVGAPTGIYSGYDLRYPHSMEYRIRYYPVQHICERELKRVVKDEKEIPYYLRYEAIRR